MVHLIISRIPDDPDIPETTGNRRPRLSRLDPYGKAERPAVERVVQHS
jgi:hypothetical protein